MAELPSLIPIFPLPNVVLFPQVMLPLHIFEPRYRKRKSKQYAEMKLPRHQMKLAMLKGLIKI